MDYIIKEKTRVYILLTKYSDLSIFKKIIFNNKYYNINNNFYENSWNIAPKMVYGIKHIEQYYIGNLNYNFYAIFFSTYKDNFFCFLETWHKIITNKRIMLSYD